MRKLLFALLFCPTISFAICLNPFGCPPETEGECIKTVSSARTESAAKAMIVECRKLPRVALSQCKVLEARWAEYMIDRAGVEWDWPDWSTKSECKRTFPKTFSPSLWVSRTYCEANAQRLAQARSEIDATSLKSLRLEQARRKAPELVDLDDRQVVEVLQSIYYPDKSKIELAAAVFVDAPPEPLAVAFECTRLVNTGGARK